jgi:hypothetical protein
MWQDIAPNGLSLLKKSLLSLQEKYGRSGVPLWPKGYTGKMI